jgi:hypothetical protein
MEDPTLPPPPSSADAVTTTLPWEDESTPFLIGLVETFKLFALRPQEAFNRLSPVGIGRPYFYALLMTWIELVVGVAYMLVFQAPFLLFGIPELEETVESFAISTTMTLFITLGVFILMPVLLAIGLFIHTCILHLMLLILGEGKKGIETTFRALCYCHTADVANVIPFCGGLISMIWFIVLQVIGIAEAHRCSYVKAALAIFLPFLLCCACIVVLISMGVGAGVLGALLEQ